MEKFSQPEIIITHEADLDGLLSGMLLQRLAKELFDEEIRLQAYQTHNWRNRYLGERTVWVTDLVFEKRLDRIGWLVVDHHVTSVQPDNATLVHDPEKSASLLVYELCREEGLGNPELDRLVHLTNVGDLFLKDDPDFQEANDYGSLVKTHGFWSLFALLDGQPEKLINHPLLEVAQVKRRVEDPIGLDWSRNNVTEINSDVALVKTVVGNSNLILHQLLEDPENKHKVLITLGRSSNKQILVSLRSRNGEALRIAHQLQGGGHDNACGASLPRSIQRIPDAIEYLIKTLNPCEFGDAGGLASLESLFEEADKQKQV